MPLPPSGPLSIRDLQDEATISKGNTNTFTEMAQVFNIDNYNAASPRNIVLADSFYNKSLNLTATSVGISPTSLSYSNVTSTQTINFSTNGFTLMVGKPAWLETDTVYLSTSNNGSISFVASSNNTLGNTERSATITFIGQGGNTYRTLSVVQAGNPASIVLTPSTAQTIATSTTSFTQDVTVTNPLVVTGTVIGSGFTLSSPVKTNLGSTSRYRFTLTMASNTGPQRTAQLNFSISTTNFNQERSITHTQSGFVETLSIAISSLSFTSTSQVKSFTVLSNTDWISNISGTGFQQSLSSTSGFTTANINGNGDDVIYIRALNNTNTSTRTGTVSVAVTDGSPSDTVNLSQAAFVETLSIATSTLSFSAQGETKFFDVVSNTNWISDITGTGYQQSLSSTSGFTTANISGNGDDRVYIRILENTGTSTRNGSASVSVLDGSPSDSVTFSQTTKPIWSNSNIAISGFDVDEFGDISVPTVTTTGNIAYTITYTTGFNSGTSYSAAAGFPLVGTNTPRYVNVTVNVPSTYQNPGSFTRTVSAIQESRVYGDAQVSITNFSVASSGAITAANVTAVGNPTITTTYTPLQNSGTPVTLARGFKASVNDETRWVNASMTVPSGWFNSNTTFVKSRSTVQQAVDLTGYLYFPSTTTTQRPGWEVGGINGQYVQSGFWAATESDTRYLTFSLRTNAEVTYRVVENGFGNFSIVSPTSTLSLSYIDFLTEYPDVSPYITHFRLKVTAPSAGQSVNTTIDLTTSDTSGKNFSIYIELGRLSGGGTPPGVTPTVDTLPTVKTPQEL